MFLVEENLTTYDGIFLYNKKSLSKSLIENNNVNSNNKINNNFYFNNCQDGKKLNINQSFVGSKNNPNDFETFNFNNRSSFIRISIKNDHYINNLNILEKETNSNSTNPGEINKNKSENNIDKTDFNNKKYGFSFLNTKTNDFQLNKSFVNFPFEENKFIKLNEKDPEININEAINIEYLQNLMLNRDRYNTDALYPNNLANTYDSNYDNSLYIETPKDHNRILD